MASRLAKMWEARISCIGDFGADAGTPLPHSGRAFSQELFAQKTGLVLAHLPCMIDSR